MALAQRDTMYGSADCEEFEARQGLGKYIDKGGLNLRSMCIEEGFEAVKDVLSAIMVDGDNAHALYVWITEKKQVSAMDERFLESMACVAETYIEDNGV